MKEQITELTHPSMYAWFDVYVSKNLNLSVSDNNLENGKLIFMGNGWIKGNLSYIKYPFGGTNFFSISLTDTMFLINSPIKVRKNFICWGSKNILSFKGFSKEIGGGVGVYRDGDVEQYSPKYKDKKRYKIYLALWLELFDSVTEKERWEYINEFKGKEIFNYKYSIIPNEILLEFGVL